MCDTEMKAPGAWDKPQAFSAGFTLHTELFPIDFGFSGITRLLIDVDLDQGLDIYQATFVGGGSLILRVPMKHPRSSDFRGHFLALQKSIDRKLAAP